MTHAEEMKIYEQALDTWPEIQERQWIEEMAEAIQAYCHWKRGRCNFIDIVTEFAHVEFCINQMLLSLSRQTSWSYRDLTLVKSNEKEHCFQRLISRLKSAKPYNSESDKSEITEEKDAHH